MKIETELDYDEDNFVGLIRHLNRVKKASREYLKDEVLISRRLLKKYPNLFIEIYSILKYKSDFDVYEDVGTTKYRIITMR